MKSWMTNRVCFTPVEAVRSGSGTGFAIVKIAGQRQIWEMSEDSEFPVTAQEPYDENALASRGDVENRCINSPPVSGASFFDRLIAANKMLINTTLDPQVKLIAAKISIEGFPHPQEPFSIELASHLGNRIFKSKIVTREKLRGEVVFYGT